MTYGANHLIMSSIPKTAKVSEDASPFLIPGKNMVHRIFLNESNARATIMRIYSQVFHDENVFIAPNSAALDDEEVRDARMYLKRNHGYEFRTYT